MKKQPSGEIEKTDLEKEVIEIMTCVHDDLAEVRNLVKKVAAVKERVVQSLDRLKREYNGNDAIVRHARALATWAQSEIDDVLFCEPAEIPDLYRSVMESPESVRPETVAQERKRKRREEKKGREEIQDDAVIDFDKLNVQVPNQN